MLFMISLNACKTEKKASELKDIRIIEDVVKWIRKSNRYEKDFEVAKKKILSGDKIAEYEKERVVTFIIGQFYESFDKYKEEMDLIFEKYVDYDVYGASTILSLSLNMKIGLNEEYYIEDYDKIKSNETYEWIIKKVDKVEIKTKEMDKNTEEYLRRMYLIVESKRRANLYLGNKKEVEKYEKLCKKYYTLIHDTPYPEELFKD